MPRTLHHLNQRPRGFEACTLPLCYNRSQNCIFQIKALVSPGQLNGLEDHQSHIWLKAHQKSSPASVFFKQEGVGEKLAVEGPGLDKEPAGLVAKQDIQVANLVVLAHQMAVVGGGQVVRDSGLKNKLLVFRWSETSPSTPIIRVWILLATKILCMKRQK